MGTLYVLEPDVYLSRSGGVLRVARRAGREVLLERPLAHVSEVVVLGNAVVTPAVVRAYVEQGSGIHYLTKGGSYVAHIAPVENKNVPLRVAQYRAHLDEGWKHRIAKEVVLGKLRNAVTFAKRGGAETGELERLSRSIERSKGDCKDVLG